MNAPKLTRKDQVLAVLQAGGHAITHPSANGVGHGIAHLYDVHGTHVEAWQTAIVSHLTTGRCHVEARGPMRVWRLKV